MKIKRYMAESMRVALAQVRAEQGPDAVILSSRRVEEGIEVIAAVDYDEALFADATSKRSSSVPAEPIVPMLTPEPLDPAAPRRSAAPNPGHAATQMTMPAPRSAPAFGPEPTSRPVGPGVATPLSPAATSNPVTATSGVRISTVARPVAATAPKPVAAATVAARTPDGGFLAMQNEVKELREMLQGELAHMSWNDRRQREPLQVRVLEDLSLLDIAPDVAAALAALTPKRTTVENPSHIPLALLVRHVPVVENLSMVNGVVALVGPTGAGKTTTIAKLAARWSMQHGPKDLALVSTDGYRIGAREQLMTYARILGAPMHVANNGKELARLLERLRSKKLVLIDTAGMGPRDVRLSEQLAALQLGAARASVLLTLPAQGEAHALEEIVKSFARVSPSACILTKVDEAASLGAALSTSIRHKLPIAYLCTGQRVPEDLHAAHQRRLWLIRVALKLKDRTPPTIGEAYYARHFGRVAAHA